MEHLFQFLNNVQNVLTFFGILCVIASIVASLQKQGCHRQSRLLAAHFSFFRGGIVSRTRFPACPPKPQGPIIHYIEKTASFPIATHTAAFDFEVKHAWVELRDEIDRIKRASVENIKGGAVEVELGTLNDLNGNARVRVWATNY